MPNSINTARIPKRHTRWLATRVMGPPIRKNAFAAAVAVVMFVALPSANAAAKEAPSMKASETVATIKMVNSLQSQPFAVTSARVGVGGATSPLFLSPGMTGLSSQSEAAWLGAVIRAIKRFGPRVWNACVNAVRAGYGPFMAWYRSLPWYIRAAIKAASAGATLYDVYVALRGAVGGLQIQSGTETAPHRSPA